MLRSNIVVLSLFFRERKAHFWDNPSDNNRCFILFGHTTKTEQTFNEAPPIGAQSVSRIYQPPPPKNKIHLKFPLGGGGSDWLKTNFQLLMLSSNLLKSKIPMSSGGGGGGLVANFQLLMLSSNLLKSKIPMSSWGGGGGGGVLVDPTFNF